MKTIIIAEAGINHNGKIQIAKKLIQAVTNSGADYIKFQTYKTENMITPKARLANYQRRNLNNSISQYNMLKKYELKKAFIQNTGRDTLTKKKIKFLSSPFDNESLSLLSKLNLDFIKVPSGEIDNYPFLKELGKLKKR